MYLRYFQPLKLSQRTAHERLTRICFIDYDREMAMVVEHQTAEGSAEIIGIGRLSKLRGRDEAELAVLVDDRFQHLGMGTELFRRLIAIAREEKVAKGGVHASGREPGDAGHLREAGVRAEVGY